MKTLTFAIMARVTLFSTNIAAQEINFYVGRAIDVYDGDTVTLEVLIWEGQNVTAKISFKGIYTREIRGRLASERKSH